MALQAERLARFINHLPFVPKPTEPKTQPILQPQVDRKEMIRQDQKFRKDIGANGLSLQVQQVLDRFRDSRIDISQANQEWNRVITEHYYYSTIVCHSPTVGGEVLRSRRVLRDVLAEVYDLNLSYGVFAPAYLAEVERYDIYDTKVKSPFSEVVSLADIEQMPLDPQLSEENIATLDGFFIQLASQLTPQPERGRNYFIRDAALLLALAEIAHPTKVVPIADDLRPLQARLLSYFDYYVQKIMHGREPKIVDELFLAGSLGGLSPALGAYLPYRLGVMPHSAMELFRQRARESQVPNYAWRNYIIAADRSATRTIQPERFSRDLRHQLSNHSKNSNFGQFSPELNIRPSNDLSADFRRQKDALMTRILRSKDRAVTLGTLAGSDEILVTTQNRKVFIVIINPKDKSLPSTVLELGEDLDGNLRVFGIPAKDILKNPSLGPNVLANLTTRLVENMGLRAVVVNSEQTVVNPARIKQTEPRKADEGENNKHRLRKQMEPREVEYDEAEIRVWLKGRPESDIQKALRGIKRFEQGSKRGKQHADVDKVWGIRLGSQRIYFRNLGHNRFRVMIGTGFERQGADVNELRG